MFLLVSVLLILLAGVLIPGLRDGALRVIGVPASTPAPRAPHDDLFYLVPNPPGVQVSVDGALLLHLPLPGSGHPLRLAPGMHTFRWSAHTFPFRPLSCRVSVPHSAGDTCPLVSREFVPVALADAPGAIIGLHAALSALTPLDQQRLLGAIQSALAAQRATTTVRPGEVYAAFDAARGTTAAVTAQQPLQATLTFSYLGDSGYPEPCILVFAIPCRFPGQDCSQICTDPQPPPALAFSAGPTWIAAVVVHANWDYTTPDGTPVASQVSEAFGVQLAAVQITYTGGQWQVSAILGNVPGFDLASDPVCDPARYLLSQTNDWAFAVNNPPPGAHMAYIAAPNPADGCAAVFLGHNLPGEEPAMFLQRFGVLRTVNAAAANPVATLPMADAEEQRLARQLLAPVSG
jgi:hypothetical protein